MILIASDRGYFSKVPVNTNNLSDIIVDLIFLKESNFKLDDKH